MKKLGDIQVHISRGQLESEVEGSGVNRKFKSVNHQYIGVIYNHLTR